MDYDSDIGGVFGSSELTKGCGELSPDDSAPAPLDGLAGSTGMTILLGIGLSNRTVGFEVRAERAHGRTASATNGRFGFGHAMSLVARYYPKV